jgi:hypothetical protein
MRKPLFNIGTSGKGRYKMQTVEKAICLRVAKKAVRSSGYSEAFQRSTGRVFNGTGSDRAILPREIGVHVDAALCKSMRRYPEKWRKSPIVSVALDRDEEDNLILNQGLDYLAAGTTNWATMGEYCVLGVGTAIPAVTDTGLATEIIRTSTKVSGSCNTTSNIGARTLTLRRTYDFPVEGSTSFPVGQRSGHNYAELGLSHTSAGTTLSTRALISGGTVTVLVGQQARVVYSIIITLGDNAVSTIPSSTGWTAGLQGTSAFCTFGGMPSVNSDGGSNAGVDGMAKLSLCAGSTIPSFGTPFTPGDTRASSSSVLNAYTTGTYKRTRTVTWNLTSGVGTWRSLIVDTGSIGTAYAWCWVFDNAQTKDNTHSLSITWSMSYGRT